MTRSGILSIILALFVASASVAAPVENRQLGNLECDIDRVKIVASLIGAGSALNAINTSDPATATAVAAAQTGLQSVGSAIENIALALISGQDAPGDAPIAISQGLNDTRSALEGITNPAVSDSVAAAAAKVQDAIDDGNGVIANCK